MRIHFISIGGSVMHNLAIALKEQGHHISGSDDHIHDPSKSRLESHGLLPAVYGWDAKRITPELDAVVLGMHAKADNPEMLEAQRIGLRIFTYPEFIREHAKNKQRIVVGGSHGKTSVTSLIIHALHQLGKPFDYVVGAVPQGLESSVRLSDEAPIIIIEGDEYPTSPLDPSPKFHHYAHHIGVVTGIAWDHFNVFPTFDKYVDAFKKFMENTPKAGALVYCAEDKQLEKAVKASKLRDDITELPYSAIKNRIKDGQTQLQNENRDWVPIKIFGEHNMLNLNAAATVCQRIGIPRDRFIEAIASFEGAKMRLELLGSNAHTRIFRDFAHAPSKVQATVNAVKGQYPKEELLACLELHTYSSLNKGFIGQYKGSLKQADHAVVFYSPEAVALKGLPMLSEQEIKDAFGIAKLQVFSDAAALQNYLLAQKWQKKVLLLMSSGNYGGLDLQKLKTSILGS